MKAIDFLDGADDLGSSQSAESFLDAAEPKKQNKGILGDIGTGLKRGVEQMPGMVTGIADIAAAPVSAITGISRPFSRAADYVGEKTGFQPSKWAEQAAQEYSPEMQQSMKAVEQADGFTGTLKAIGENPRSAVNLIAESLPSTLAGGILARGAMGAVVGAEKLAAMKAAGDTAGLMKAGAIAGGIGEGAVTAGQQMSQTDYNVNPLRAAGSATAAGIGTGIIGGVSGRIANKIGLADIEGSIAAGTLGAGKKAGIGAYAGRIAGGAVQEGALEEMPQSAQEQVWQNVASSKPWDEGVGKASAQGLVAGMAMGAGVNALPGGKRGDVLPADSPAAKDLNQSLGGDVSAAPTLTTDIDPMHADLINRIIGVVAGPMDDKQRAQYEKDLAFALDPASPSETVGYTTDANGIEIPFTMRDYVASTVRVADMTRDQPKAARANVLSADRLAELGAEESTQQPDIAPGYVPPVIPVVGPLSAIANAAVQSGAHQTAVMQQAAAQAAKNTPPEGKAGTPAGAQNVATAPAQGPLTEVAGQAPNVATSAPNVATPASAFDVSGKNLLQLKHLAAKGQPGWKEAATAELARRNGSISESVPALNAGNSVNLPATSISSLQDQLDKTEPFSEQSQLLTERLQLAVTDDAKSAIGAGEMPVYKVTDHVSVAIHPSAQKEGMIQVTRYTKDGVIGDSQYNSIDEAVRFEGLTHKPRIPSNEAIAHIENSIAAEAEYQKRKNEQQAGAGLPAPTAGGSRPAPVANQEPVKNQSEQPLDMVPSPIEQPVPEDYKGHLIYQSEMAGGKFMVRKKVGGELVGRGFVTAEEARATVDAVSQPKTGDTEKSVTGPLRITENADMGQFTARTATGESMGSFQIKDGKVANIKARAQWAMDDVRAAAEEYAKRQSQPKTDTAPEAKQDKAPVSNRFERKWPLSVAEAEAQGIIVSGHDANRNATRWGVGDNWSSSDGNFATAGEALDHYYQVTKPNDEASAGQQAESARSDALAEFKDKKAWPVFKDIEAGTIDYVDPSNGEIVTMTISAYRQQVFKLEEQFGTPSKSIGSMEDLRAVSAEIKQAKPTGAELLKARIESDKAKASDTDTRFSKNTIFTADKVAAAKARMKAKLGTMNSGIDPELLIDGMTVAGAYIESGVRKFADYAKAMVEDLGDGVKPYLLSFYEAARAYPGLNKMGMDSADSAASQHQALLTPEVKAAAKEVIGQAPKVEKKKPANLGEAVRLKADWGVQNIDGYTKSKTGKNQQTDAGLNGGVKDEFLADATRYLKSVAKILEANGFAAQLDSKGKPFKVVTTGEGGPAVGGDVYLRMSKGGFEAFAQVGVTNIRGMGPAHPQGVSLMTRVGERSGMNNWLATDLTAGDLSAWFDKQHQAFAKRSVEVKPAAPAKESYDLSKADDKFKVATEISDFLIGGGEFKTIIEARKKISEMIGRPIEAATELAKQADETIETAVVMAGRDIVKAGRKQGRTPEVIYTRLVDLYRRQPNLAVRSSTSVRDQAYSTPVPLAYLASELAGITYDTKVLEPTAGNGMLLIGASVGNSVVNELNPDRADVLRSLGFNPTERNAATEQLRHAGYPVDAVIANPPFGATKDANGETIVYDIKPGFKTREVDHAIVFKSLETMKDDGRAVLIVGGVQAEAEEARREDYRGANKRSFYFNLYNEYNVIDHFTVDRGLYSKQGASYPVDIIVIDGRGKSSRDMPAADLPVIYKSYDALKEKLNGNGRVESEPVVGASGTDSGNGQAGNGDTPAVAGSPVGSSVKDGNGSAAGVSAGGVRNDGTADNGRPSGSGAVSSGGQSESPNASGPVDGVRVSDANRNAEAGSKAGNRGNGSADLGGVSVVNGERVESGLTDRRGKEQETGHQVAYTPHSNAASVGTLVPRAMKDSIAASLQKISDEVGSIDDYVAESLAMDLEDVKANFSAEQIDALALAIRNAEAGKGFIIGDQTGIGKGRVVAAMIRYALVTGKTPIFVTEKPNLYSDMIRDLDDIGMTAELALDTKNPKVLITNGGESIPYTLLRTENGEVVENNLLLRAPKSGKALDQIMQGMMDGDSLGEYKVIFTTYSQLQTVKGATTTRQKFIQRFGEGNYMVFDESHNAGGAGETQARTKEQRQAAKDGESLVTGRAAFVRNLVQKAFGTFFSSATYAKRPDVMDLYSSTNMKLAVDKISQLGEAIKAGGVPMQQVVANMLTKDGQYIRRERTFAGVSYDTQETKVDKVTAENMASAMRSILAFSRAKDSVIKEIQKEMDREGGMINEMGGEKSSVQGANFGSIMHNLIDQMLLSLKVQDSVSHAIERLKAGEKVVLTVSNTMGSFLKDYSEELGIATGDPVSMSFADLYSRYLEKQRNVTIKDGGGNKRQHRLTDAELGPRLVDMFNAVRKQIESSGFGSAPISPIDYMHNELRKAGYKTDEITGRTIALNYSSGTPILASRTANIRQRVKAVSGFNNGETDVLILNQAGSTGLSLHASSKFKDQRKRHMIIVQAEKNIDTHMQMLGRVHRTGQVVAPAYSQMMADIPAEMRPASVLMKKMASLNANTTASRTSSVTAEGVVDFMNNYGGQVVHEYLRDNPDVLEAVGGNKVISLADDPAEAGEDDIRKFTGYIPILPIKQQEEVYRELVDRYNELIERENSLGTNKLEAKAVDLDAETISSQTVTEDRGDPSVFASPANMEKVDVKRTVKPYSSEEVAAMVSESLDGKTANQVAATQLADLFDKATAYGKEKVAKMVADEVDPVKLDSQKAQLQLVLSHARTVLNTYKIGDSISVKDQIGQFVYGVITKIERSGRTANPAAGSAWKMHVALANGDAKSITLSFSQIGSKYELRAENRVEWYNTDTQSVERIPVSDIFDKGAKVRREKRWIVTGNILAGFARFPGQIITYTKNDGTTAQGVLMSRQFDFEKEQKNAPVRIKDGKAAIKFFTNGGQGGIIGTPDRFLMIAPRRGEFEITVPSSKKDGGTYYLDTGLTNIVGDFYKRGSIMSASVYTTGDVERVVNYLVKDREETIIALSNVEKAKELLEGNTGAGNIAATVDAKKQEEAKPVALLSIAGREKFDPISLDTAAGVVARMRQTIKEVWKVDLRLVPTFSALPQEVKDAIAKYGEDTRAKGVLHKGSVYIVADEHASDADVETTILHEIKGHVGLRRLYSDAINKGLGALYMSIGGRRGLADLAKVRGFTDELQGYAESLSNSDFTDEERTRIVMEELLSHIAQDPKFGDKVKAIVGKIRAWLRDNGFMALAKFGEADLLNILAKASKALETVRDDNGPVVLMTAWHGSPHNHDKFDSSKIGTGEGAQAYGHGLYFAGARSVAEWYRNALSKRNSGNSLNDRMAAITIDGKPVMDFGIDMDSELADMAAEGDLFGAYFHANKRADRWAEFASDESYQFKDYAKEKSGAWRNLESALETAKEFRSSEKGRLYQVELAPSEDEYLDWDKPLSEQSELVREALKSVGLPKKYHSEDKTGRDIYKLLSGESASHITGRTDSKQGDKSASEYLHSIGIRGIRYLDGSSRSKGEGNSNYVIFSDDDVTITAKYNLADKSNLSPADKAIYGMAAEGKSAAEILKFIASASRNPFNRQVARLLLKTGIAPNITVGDGKTWKISDAKSGEAFAAAYDPKTNTVALFRPASAERNALHELIHAASLKALAKNGLASAQMKALFAHVEKTGKLTGMYGIRNVDEFIAEAFSNPKFQAALKQVSAAPVGGKPSSEWDWFVRVVRGILGLKQGQENALSQALDIGVGVMRENMALQSGDGVIRFNHALRSTPEGNRPLNAIRLAKLRRIAAGLERPKDAVFLRVTEDGKAITTGPKGVRIPETFIRFAESNGLDFEARRNGEGRKSGGHMVGDHITSKTEPMPAEYRESGALYFGEGNEFFDRTGKTRYNAAPGKINQTDTEAFKRWFGDSKVVDSDGNPLVVYHGTKNDFTSFNPDSHFGTKDQADSILAEARGKVGKRVMPVYLSAQKMKRVKDQEIAQRWSDVVATAKRQGYDGLIYKNEFEGDGTQDSYVVFKPEQIKSAIGNSGDFDATNPDIRYNVADEGWSVSEQAKETVMRLAGRPMLDPSDPFAAENARLREQDQSLWSKAKKQLRRYLAPGGLLPQSVFAEKIKRDSEFQAVEFDVRHLIGGLEHAVKADFGIAFDKLSKEQMRPITEALAGNVPASLPESTKTAAVAMRQYIDGMSTEYLKIIQQKIDAKMLKALESGKDSDKAQAINEIELFEKIKGNIGRYVHRSYQAFDDPKWFEKVPAHVLNASRLYLKQGYMEAGETDAKAAQMAEVTLHEILKNGTAYDSMESFIAESKLGAKDLSVLMRRKEVPTQIRALLGEYPDARLNFTKSATKMGRLIWNTRFLDRVRDMGMGSFFFEGKDRPPNATTQIAADGSEVYAPLNGLWTFPETAQAFKDALGKEQMSDLYRFIVRANGLVKYGKAQPLDAEIKTPTGPIVMGDVEVGTVVCGIDGPTTVTGVFPQGDMDVYRLTFCDGSSTEASDEHLWNVTIDGKERTLTTADLLSLPSYRIAKRQVSVPLGRAHFDTKDVPLDPYLMGVLLGDGSFRGSVLRLSTPEKDIVDRVRALLPEGYAMNSPASWSDIDYAITAPNKSEGRRHKIRVALEEMGLWGHLSLDKFIPVQYMRNSHEIRMEVARGLLDTDGWVDRLGQPHFTTSSRRLAEDFQELAESLGASVIWGEKESASGNIAYDLGVRVEDARKWFWLPRKAEKATPRKKPAKRTISTIEYVGMKQCQCIMVDDPRHLYLTDRFIVTHNTVLAPTTAMRNWQSAMFFSLANGHFDLTQMKKSISAFREQVSQKATGQDLKYLRHLKQLGVVYDTPYAGEMARLMEDARMEELLSSDKGDAVRWFRKANQLAQGFYTFGDDFWKIIGFENEKAGLMKAGLSLQEAEIEAAKRIRDTYPTYSMVGRGVQWLSRFPLAGTFVSFPAEIIRTSGNMLRTVAADLKSDNPKLRELGMKRAAGMVFVSAAFYSLAALSMAMAGVGDDEDEAIRDLAPEWQKNSTFLYLGRDEKGNLRYFDMSFLDPYGYWKRPITAMLRNQPWEDSLASGLRGMLEPFLGADISAKAIFEAVSNAKESGGKVYKENDGAIDQAVDIADHLRKALQPGVVGNVERLVKAAGDVRKSSGQPYSMEDELVALAGWRATTIEPKTALYYRSFEFTDSIAEARKTLTDTLRDANDVSPEDIKDARERAKSKQEQAFKEMSRLVGAAEAAGMSKMQIVQTLRLSNISQANIASLMRGATPDVSITPQLAARAVRQASQMRGPEFAADVFDRYRQAMAK